MDPATTAAQFPVAMGAAVARRLKSCVPTLLLLQVSWGHGLSFHGWGPGSLALPPIPPVLRLPRAPVP